MVRGCLSAGPIKRVDKGAMVKYKSYNLQMIGLFVMKPGAIISVVNILSVVVGIIIPLLSAGGLVMA